MSDESTNESTNEPKEPVTMNAAPTLRHYLINVTAHERENDRLMKHVKDDFAYDADTGIERIVCAETPLDALKMWCEHIAAPDSDDSDESTESAASGHGSSANAKAILDLINYEYTFRNRHLIDMWRLPDIKFRGIVSWEYFTDPPHPVLDSISERSIARLVHPSEWVE